MPNIQEVMRYQEIGFTVLPACPPDHDCPSPGKVPFLPSEGIHMPDWSNAVQFSRDQWAYFFECCPNLNIGCLCGNGYVFIDLDDEESEREYERLQALDARATDPNENPASRNEANGTQTSPWKFRTGKGVRYIFLDPSKSTLSHKRVAGPTSYIEVLSGGRFTVLPSSRHASSGKSYQWDSNATPRTVRIATVPAWVRGSEGAGTEGSSPVTGDRADWKSIIGRGAGSGSRNDTLTRLAGHLIAPQPIPIGEVALWMHAYNKTFCSPPLEDRELEAIISSIHRREEASEGKIRKIMATHNVPRDIAEEYLTQGIEG